MFFFFFEVIFTNRVIEEEKIIRNFDKYAQLVSEGETPFFSNDIEKAERFIVETIGDDIRIRTHDKLYWTTEKSSFWERRVRGRRPLFLSKLTRDNEKHTYFKVFGFNNGVELRYGNFCIALKDEAFKITEGEYGHQLYLLKCGDKKHKSMTSWKRFTFLDPSKDIKGGTFDKKMGDDEKETSDKSNGGTFDKKLEDNDKDTKVKNAGGTYNVPYDVDIAKQPEFKENAIAGKPHFKENANFDGKNLNNPKNHENPVQMDIQDDHAEICPFSGHKKTEHKMN